MGAWPWGPVRKLLSPWGVRPLLKPWVSHGSALWPTTKDSVLDVYKI